MIPPNPSGIKTQNALIIDSFANPNWKILNPDRKENLMKLICPECNHSLSVAGECGFCGDNIKKPTSVLISLLISVLVIGVIGLGTIAYIKMVGNPRTGA